MTAEKIAGSIHVDKPARKRKSIAERIAALDTRIERAERLMLKFTAQRDKLIEQARKMRVELEGL